MFTFVVWTSSSSVAFWISPMRGSKASILFTKMVMLLYFHSARSIVAPTNCHFSEREVPSKLLHAHMGYLIEDLLTYKLVSSLPLFALRDFWDEHSQQWSSSWAPTISGLDISASWSNRRVTSKQRNLALEGIPIHPLDGSMAKTNKKTINYFFRH